jgi:hypothetical protein
MCMCETSTAFVCKFSSMVLIALIGRIQFKRIQFNCSFLLCLLGILVFSKSRSYLFIVSAKSKV